MEGANRLVLPYDLGTPSMAQGCPFRRPRGTRRVDRRARFHTEADLWRLARRDPGRGYARSETFLTGGIVQVPSMIDGLLSFGQYIRSMRMNLPAGAGSQFDSLSVPGESFWM